MDNKPLTDLQRWAKTWQQAGPKLAEIRRRELQAMDTQQALANLADAFEFCRIHCPLRASSGLVEQQAWFKKLRE